MTRTCLSFVVLLVIPLFHSGTCRLVKKGNAIYYDEDCKRPRCVYPQTMVCPTSDNCSCYCRDVPCYLQQCPRGYKTSCLTKVGWCQCKCVRETQRCADAWDKTCLAVCVGERPCKCNCVGQYNQHERHEYKKIG
ncbi:uncharacterized protein [Dermacentor andersoni]|uniref:uncharacterized protein n=1 Tax=Dermacentor andersoni TaxID=34620 RepID=UPI00215569A9|nr:uncharacterized protein LOC126533827 [Dermacentor andersoni]